MKCKYLLFILIGFSSLAHSNECDEVVKEKVLEGSVFFSKFNSFGNTCFYAKKSSEFKGGYDFYIRKLDGSEFRFPRSSHMSSYFSRIAAVSFKDFDGDNFSDVAIIFDEITNKDPIRSLIYYRGTRYGYELDDKLSERFVINNGESVSDINKLTRHGK
jgi:hypothetical protein